jgi:hypothetical protein
VNEPDRRCLVLVQSNVPDFFQEDTTDGLHAQVDWLVREVGLDDSFFAALAGMDEVTFSNWRARDAGLPPSGEETLRILWRTVLHVLSFLNFDRSRVRALFLQTMPVGRPGEESALTPPWSGESLKSYLQRARGDGIEKVEGWVTGLRFGDPYAA